MATSPTSTALTFEQYNQSEKVNTATILAIMYLYLREFLHVNLTDVQWVSLIQNIYPYVWQYRDNSSTLARSFYDAERESFRLRNLLNLDSLSSPKSTDLSEKPFTFAGQILERFDTYKANYTPQQLFKAVEPVREKWLSEDTTDGTLTKTLGVIAKQVQNGGRETTREAADKDPIAQGWARVQGGGESCAFCWMLISRGPVYSSGEVALLKHRDDYAVDTFRRWQSTGNDNLLRELMNRYHENCDCRVVPVFNKDADWPGKDDYLLASKVWGDTTGGVSGHDKYVAFRRAMGDGYNKGNDTPLTPPSIKNF